MSSPKEEEFIERIQKNAGIIHKIIGLYVDQEEDKKDMYQEVLLQAWKSYQKFQGRSKFSTWLYKVSLNTVLTFIKKETKKVTSNPLTSKTDDVKPTEKHELLYLLVKQLPEIERMIMTLHLDGFKNKEIAEITGINNNNITVKLHRIKNQIISKYKKLL